MANQIEATIARIGSSAQPEGTVMSFPVRKIMIIEASTGCFILYNGVRYYSAQSVAELADGSPLLQATVIQVNTSQQPQSKQIAFHSELVEILPSQGVSGANSVIKFGSTQYYVTETMSSLVDTANEPTEVTVYELSTTLTDAQIKALPTTPIELVEAPGDGKVIKFQGAIIVTNFVSGYTNITAATGANDSCAFLCVLGNFATELSNYANNNSILTDNVRRGATLTPQQYYRDGQSTFVLEERVWALDDMMNLPLNLACYNNAGDFTGGHASNTLKVTVFYSIVDL